MLTKMSLKDQRGMYNSLPASRKLAVKRHCESCSMRGEGIQSILMSIGQVLGPIVKELGPKVLKEIVAPLIVKYVKDKAGLKGDGLSLAGNGVSLAGSGLKLAGNGKKMTKGSQEMKDHMARIRMMRKKK
jgi:hypothetical protein